MKTSRLLVFALFVAPLFFVPSSLAFADSSLQTNLAPMDTKSAPATLVIPDVTYPYTFVCVHCGIKITVKSKADWMKPCPVCPCGTTTLGCLPKAKISK